MTAIVPLVTGPARARRFFDALAPAYERINARIYKPEWRERVRAAIRGRRVLDVGVGTGFTTDHLEDGVGLDLSLEMLRRARYRGSLVRGDLMASPFRDGSFETVVFAGSFYYLRDPVEALHVAAGLLVSGGTILILSPATSLLAPFVRVYTRENYVRFADAAGVRIESYERLNWAACLVIARTP